MTTPSVRDGNSSVRIADGLRDAILRGDLPPGSRIRQEDVAVQYGASRIPVRGALRILESDGLVTLVANSGAWVARFSLAECEEIYQIRERLEPLLLSFSAPRLGPEEFRRLARLAEEMRAAPDVSTFLALDREFHFLSYSGASTVVLQDYVERLWNTTQHYRRAFMLLLDSSGIGGTHDEHRMLVTALVSGDQDHAELVLRGHIRRTRQQLARHPEVFEAAASGRNAPMASAREFPAGDPGWSAGL